MTETTTGAETPTLAGQLVAMIAGHFAGNIRAAAARCRVPYGTLHDLTCGKSMDPKASTVAKLAHGFDCTFPEMVALLWPNPSALRSPETQDGPDLLRQELERWVIPALENGDLSAGLEHARLALAAAASPHGGEGPRPLVEAVQDAQRRLAAISRLANGVNEEIYNLAYDGVQRRALVGAAPSEQGSPRPLWDARMQDLEDRMGRTVESALGTHLDPDAVVLGDQRQAVLAELVDDVREAFALPGSLAALETPPCPCGDGPGHGPQWCSDYTDPDGAGPGSPSEEEREREGVENA